MAFLSRELVWLLCIVGYFHRMNASTVQFSASPIEIKTNITQTSSMRCSLEDGNTSSIPTPDVRRVTSIFVTKEDGTDVASITAFDPAMALVDLGIMDSKGSLSATSNDGFLELSWSDASRMTLGGYTCVITGIDTRGHTVVMNSDLTMTSVTPSISDVVVMFQTQNQQLKDLTEKDAKDTARNAAEISALEQKLDDQNKEITALKQQDANETLEIASLKQQDALKILEIASLKQQDALKTLEIASLKQQDVVTSHMLANQSVDVLDLKTCASTQAAFMAVLSSTTTVTLDGDTPVIYDKVVTNTDGSYDPSNGQFKCTTPGVYLLSVSGETKYAVELDILINSVKITSTTFYTDKTASYWASGFASAIVTLKVNDIVHVETEASFTESHSLHQGTAYAYQPNVFQGTLLHSDNCVF